MNRLINKLRVVNSRLFIVYERSVSSVQSDQKPAKVSRDLKKSEKLVDTNGYVILIQRGDKFCADELSKKASKAGNNESGNCVPTSHQYLYPSGQGFWFLDNKNDKLVHLSVKDIRSTTIAAKTYQVMSYRGVTNNVGVREADTTDIYAINDHGVQRVSSVEKICHADSNVLFSGEANPIYWELTCYQAGLKDGELDVDVVEVANGLTKQTVKANSIPTHGTIKNLWVCHTTGKTYPLLVAFENGQHTLFNERGNLQWTRGPDLEDAIDVLAADFPSEDMTDEIPVYEAFGNNLVGAFMYRVYSDFKSLSNLAVTVLPRLGNINIQGLIDKITGKKSNEIGELGYYNKYGLRKILVFVTRYNKLVGVDSLNGHTLWNFALKAGQNIEKAIINSENVVELVFQEGDKRKKVLIRALDGSAADKEVVLGSGAQVFLHDSDKHETFGASFKANFLSTPNSDFSFYRVVKNQGIFGYFWNAETQKFEETWNYLVEPGQEILDYGYHLKGSSDYLSKSANGSISALPEDDSLYYKVVDSGNVALLMKQTINDKDIMTVTIINTVRGKVLASLVNDAVDFSQPLGFVFDDNGVYVSYMNSRLGSFELWSIEIMATRIETSFVEMIQIYVLGIKKKELFDYHADKPMFVVMDKKYGLPFGLKHLGAVSTRHGLTKRNLIGLTTSNNVRSDDQRLFPLIVCLYRPVVLHSRSLRRQRAARRASLATILWSIHHTTTSCL